MAKKSSGPNLFVTLGVFVASVLIVGAFMIGKQQISSASVLGTNTGNAASVASAAYAKCVDNGGFVNTQHRGSWGYYNTCNFADDMTCELYALYEGQCPVGGVHTIGYSTSPQVFCALRGGTPQGKNNGQCKLPNGTVCSTDSVYKGTCSN